MVRFGRLDKDAETTDSGNWKPQTPSRKLQPRYVRQNVVIPTPPLLPAPKHLLRLQELDWVQCELCGEEQRQGCGFRITAPNKGDTTDASQDPAMVAKGDKEED